MKASKEPIRNQRVSQESAAKCVQGKQCRELGEDGFGIGSNFVSDALTGQSTSDFNSGRKQGVKRSQQETERGISQEDTLVGRQNGDSQPLVQEHGQTSGERA